MFSQYKYLYCVLFFVLQNSIQKSIAISISDKVTRILNILNQKSWRSFEYPEKGIADQQIFVDESYGQFIDIMRIPFKMYSINLDIITSTMYVALGCKCGETIVDILTIFLKWLDFVKTVDRTLVSHLEELNRTILKTISVMFYFIDISPNVLTFEPGILKMAIQINFHLNYLFEILDIKEYSEFDTMEISRLLFQMINLLERFTISYCSSRYNKPNIVHYSNCRIESFASPVDPTENSIPNILHHAIKYFENLLDNTGLSILNYHKYNIKKNTSDGMSPDEDSLKFNIILHVRTCLNSLLGNQQIFLKLPKIDIEDVFVYQKSMFDLIMLIFHINTEAYLVEQKRYQDKELKSCFLNKSNIRENQLIEYYEELKIESDVKKFPTDFVNQIKLILRILKSIHYSYKILDIYILIMNERNQIDVIKTRLKENIELDDNIIAKFTYPVNVKYPLHLFLKNIVSIKYVVYFNEIYNLLQSDIIKRNNEVYENLNNIYHNVAPSNINCYCEILDSVYAFSFDLLLSINNSNKPTTELKSLKNGFNSILIIMRAIQIMEKQNMSSEVPLCFIMIYADQYLSYNLIKYPQNRPQEKLNRILYLLTNFIDRHHLLNCSFCNYRDSIFKSFEKDQGLLKKRMSLKQRFLLRLLNIAKATLIDDETNNKLNLSNFVLFETFLNNIQFTKTQLKPYWNGKLKSINGVKGYMNENLFNFFSIPNYIKTFFEWITAYFSYSVLNIINLILTEVSDFRYLYTEYDQFKGYKYEFKQMVYYGSKTHDLVFNRLEVLSYCVNEVKSHILKFKILDLKLILESYLKHYTSKCVVVEKPEGHLNIFQQRSNTVNQLTNIIESAEIVSKILPTANCWSKDVLNPLIYVFAHYFDIHRTLK